MYEIITGNAALHNFDARSTKAADYMGLLCACQKYTFFEIFMFQGLIKNTLAAPSSSGSNRLRILRDDSDFPKGRNILRRISEKLNQDLRCFYNFTSFLLHKVMLKEIVSDIVVDYC